MEINIPQLIVINNLEREYIWENQTICGRSSRIWDEISQGPHRKDQIAMFHPAIFNFYKNKNVPWTIDTPSGIGNLGNFREEKPERIDLTRDPAFLPPPYDFDPEKRLALVCDLPGHNEKLPFGFIGARYRLIPLREGEYSETNPAETPQIAWLNSFGNLVENHILEIENIPIEIIARPGEIDRTRLRKRMGAKAKAN
tara:strand:+ start:103 stop:696 length:594 start_codon:yes stop_codon:yes gene_type:complete